MAYKNWKEFKAAWLKALRSGEYKQGTGTLCRAGRKYDKFCCLGVAGNLLVEAGNSFEWENDGQVRQDMWLKNTKTGEINASCISDVAPAWLERVLSKCEGAYQTKEGVLMNMNDEGGDFKAIADWIEKNM